MFRGIYGAEGTDISVRQDISPVYNENVSTIPSSPGM